VNYVSDTGAANVYVVTLSPVPGSYTAGLRITFQVAHANTGASTLNVNALGTKSIKKEGGVALESGDIQAGQLVEVVYDGTNFQITNTLQVSPSYSGQSTITTVGTISSGTWQGTALAVAFGGTGAATASAAFNALSPMTTLGDLILWRSERCWHPPCRQHLDHQEVPHADRDRRRLGRAGMGYDRGLGPSDA